MSMFTFLEKEQIVGKNRLHIIRRRGAQAAVTDFSILLGGGVTEEYIPNKKGLENRTGGYWTKSNFGDYKTYVVSPRY